MAAVVGVLISAAGLAHLAATDAKRRRAFGLSPHRAARHGHAARIMLFGPGGALALAGDWAGFAIWLGALSCGGWALVAVDPPTWRRIARRAAGLGARRSGPAEAEPPSRGVRPTVAARRD
ncbi:hypothetical protein [Rubrimonas cliftonensis]|uniref:Uncharacterized protein n=1 Tax=Rubrimonas cliftonensis TaxID=89524 RepID=A0A1H4F228_9RHOB|nr:hypothetical protein [Rubrimonas cliftonensis]SEA90522.1 hypothetical protein SAMN05444370_11731 [Rubrimonas cliftonensis]